MSSQAEKNAVVLALHDTKFPLIVELGAHIGEEYEWMKSLSPCEYLMVEPDRINFDKIVDRYPHGRALFCAIGDYNSKSQPFYSSQNHASLNRASGSLRKPTGHLKHFPEVTFAPITTQVWTLDSLMAHEGIEYIDLLWCDIQGAERDMIEGGRATLAKTRYMMIEAEPEVELYEGQALKPELIAMLPDWEIIKDFGYNLFMRNTKYA